MMAHLSLEAFKADRIIIVVGSPIRDPTDHFFRTLGDDGFGHDDLVTFAGGERSRDSDAVVEGLIFVFGGCGRAAHRKEGQEEKSEANDKSPAKHQKQGHLNLQGKGHKSTKARWNVYHALRRSRIQERKRRLTGSLKETAESSDHIERVVTSGHFADGVHSEHGISDVEGRQAKPSGGDRADGGAGAEVGA